METNIRKAKNYKKKYKLRPFGRQEKIRIESILDNFLRRKQGMDSKSYIKKGLLTKMQSLFFHFITNIACPKIPNATPATVNNNICNGYPT